MRHYYTLFDENFVPQGLALYESLTRHSSEPFELNVLAMDEECELILESLALPNLVVDHYRWMEKEMKTAEARKTRTWQELCWTCASAYLHTAQWMAGESEVTYLDADTFFFSDPEVIFAEIGNKSIGIIPHRFPQHRKYMEANGKFNVSWVTFRVKDGELAYTPVGFKCLEKWARQCREKCSAKEGCGDQCYLDAWPTDYPGEVCEIQNIGVGAAPWNLSRYIVAGNENSILLGAASGDHGSRIDFNRLVMYHFHEYQHGKRLTNYKLRKEDRELIYAPYIQAVEEARTRVEALCKPSLA